MALFLQLRKNTEAWFSTAMISPALHARYISYKSYGESYPDEKYRSKQIPPSHRTKCQAIDVKLGSYSSLALSHLRQALIHV